MSFQFESQPTQKQNQIAVAFKSSQNEADGKKQSQRNLIDSQTTQCSFPNTSGRFPDLNQQRGFVHDFSNVPVQQKSTDVTQPRPSDEYLEKRPGASSARAAEGTTVLPTPLQQGLENLSGLDLSGVLVHYNSAKPAQMNALAYTQGKEVYVGPGQEKYLPHEGWHVVQQMQGRVQPTTHLNGLPVNNEEQLEREADKMGAKATRTPGEQSQLSIGADPQNLPGYSMQKKSIFSNIANQQGLTIDKLESRQGFSVSGAAQLQAAEETDMQEEQPEGETDEAKRAEYEALKPESGIGNREQSARTSGSGNTPGTDEELSQMKSNHIVQRNGCTPSNTAVSTNALSYVSRTRESWRSHVTYRARVNNQNDHLSVGMYVFAKVYYGLWVSWEHLDFSATVDLTCQNVSNKCEIAVNERGGSVWDLTHSPASGAIAIQTDSRAGGTQMGLSVRVGGAVGANSSISAGVGPASAGVSFPDASISHKMSMGTFIYTCSS